MQTGNLAFSIKLPVSALPQELLKEVSRFVRDCVCVHVHSSILLQHTCLTQIVCCFSGADYPQHEEHPTSTFTSMHMPKVNSLDENPSSRDVTLLMLKLLNWCVCCDVYSCACPDFHDLVGQLSCVMNPVYTRLQYVVFKTI